MTGLEQIAGIMAFRILSEELGSAQRCYDAGSLLKGKNIEGKIRNETERVRGNVVKVQKDDTGSSEYTGNFVRFTYSEFQTEDIAKNCFSDIPS